MHWKTLFATLVAAVSLVGGAHAFAPASANAETMQEGSAQCADWLRDYFPSECAEMEQGSGGDGGWGSGEVEVIQVDDNPYPGGGEVIVVEDTKPYEDPFGCIYPGSIFCDSPPEKCPNPNLPCPKPPEIGAESAKEKEARTARQAEKEKEDKEYAECMAARKKYKIGSPQFVCPVYCPDGNYYAAPLFTCKRARLIQAHLPQTLEQFMEALATCQAVQKGLKRLEKIEERLRKRGDFSQQEWKEQGFRQDGDELRAKWRKTVCTYVIYEF
jgi:hypothetical protein